MTILKKIGLSKRYGKAIIYFYLNLGISRKEYYYIPFVVEFVCFNDEPETDYVMDITDDLFLLRDGYTFPIKCREDLIHHGYILR